MAISCSILCSKNMSDFALHEILVFHYLDLTWSDLIYMCMSVHLQTVEGLLGFRRHIVSAWPPFFIYRELKQFLFKMLCRKCIWSTLLDPFNQYQKLCISWQVRVWINKVFSRFLNKPMVFHSIHWIYWFYANMKQNIEQCS